MRVLMSVDGSSHCQAALDFLRSRRNWLAAESPEIELVHVCAPLPSRFAEILDPQQIACMHEEAAREIFDSLQHIDDLPRVTKKMLIGSAGFEIVQDAAEHAADLIVVGARGNGFIDSMLIGSVSQTVIAKSNKPVLICHDEPAPEKENLVVGIAADGSGSSDAALDFIVRHRSFFGEEAEFRIIYVVPDYQCLLQKHPENALLRFIPEIPTLEAEDFAEVTSPVLEKFRKAGLNASPVMLRGDAGPAIVAYAEHELDLIVAGSHGKGNIRALFMGSTARHIAALTRCPMLVVRSS